MQTHLDLPVLQVLSFTFYMFPTCWNVMIFMMLCINQMLNKLYASQATASALIAVSQRIGAESTASFIMPQLKVIFDALAFSQPTTLEAGTSGRSSKILASKSEEKFLIGSRIGLVCVLCANYFVKTVFIFYFCINTLYVCLFFCRLLLYPSFACLIGIERLRQCCSTWFILEQILSRDHNWQASILFH